MNLAPLIEKALRGRDLAQDEISAFLEAIEREEASPIQAAGLLVALRAKGESLEEIVSAASDLDRKALKLEVDLDPLLDTCGTGGDHASTFNISTAVAFVAAAAGVYVAKHGSRSVSSRSGSADLLERAGVRIDLTPEEAVRCLREVGIVFLFAPNFHPLFAKVAPLRRELGVKTLFNLLGPLLNPTGAPYRLLGVFSKTYLGRMASALGALGCRRAVVVHAADGLDEISVSSESYLAEWSRGSVRSYTVSPEAFGLKRWPLEAIRVSSPAESLDRFLEALSGKEGPARDVVALNGAAALYACERVASLEEGLELAMALLKEGKALKKFEQLVAWTSTAPAS